MLRIKGKLIHSPETVKHDTDEAILIALESQVATAATGGRRKNFFYRRLWEKKEQNL